MNKASNSSWPAIIVFSLIAIFGIGYFAIPPYIATNKDLNLNLAVTNEKISKTQQKIADLTYLKEQFATNKNEVDQLNIALTKGNHLPDIITSIQEIAMETGIEISDIKPTSKDKNSAGAITLTAKGFYDGLKAFFTKLNNNIQPMSITDIALTQTSTDITSGMLAANLSISIFQVDQSSSQTTQTEKKEE